VDDVDERGGELGGGELERAGPLEVSVGVRDAVGFGEFFGDERGSGELEEEAGCGRARDGPPSVGNGLESHTR
jgi:hypothetical protein